MFIQKMYYREGLPMGRVATMLGISRYKVLCLEAKGKLSPIRTDRGHRRYLVSDVEKLLEKGKRGTSLVVSTRVVIYCSVPRSDKDLHEKLSKQHSEALDYIETKSNMVVKQVFRNVDADDDNMCESYYDLYTLVLTRVIDQVIIQHPNVIPYKAYKPTLWLFAQYRVSLICLNKNPPSSPQ